ncbi:sulfite reductase [NADPH] flavoprotein component [Mycoemilia scoparia]|uniref:assimilatory sulfite reductase (NADPH) n=1 Tax=Mycoemilia scoparia TaxID=417184 RepID=A0A9W8A0Y2_9FUNG|nr:sulfite reductase [NADPH] flavoprotein component [Mycoemilia scoparia]
MVSAQVIPNAVFKPQTSLVVGLQVSDKRAVVFGNDTVAHTRALFALDAGAKVSVIISDSDYDKQKLDSKLAKLIETNKSVELLKSHKLSADLFKKASVCFVTKLWEEIALQDLVDVTRSLGIPVNVAGNDKISDFTLVSTYSGKSSGLQIAVTTNGTAPRVANNLLKEIVRKLPDGLESQLYNIARLNDVARKAEDERNKALESLDNTLTKGIKDSKHGSSPSDSGFSSSAPTAAQTPSPRSSATSEKDPNEEAAGTTVDYSRYALDFDLLGSSGSAEVIQETDSQTASGYVAYNLSDVIYVYSSPEQDIGSGILAWSQHKQSNLAGSWTPSVRMQTRNGAGKAILGSISSGAFNPSVVASSASVPYLLPLLQQFVREKRSAVFHISTRSFDNHGDSRSELSKVLCARQTGAIILSSSTVQEAYDVAVISHIVSRATQLPVIHVVGDEGIDKFKVPISVANYEKLGKLVAQIQEDASTSSNAHSAVASAFAAFEKETGRHYDVFGYSGSQDADVVVATMGNAHSLVLEAINSLSSTDAKVGLLNLRLYCPWDIHNFVSALPSSVSRVIVLGENESTGSLGSSPRADPLYVDISTSVLIGRPADNIKTSYENVYGLGLFEIENLIRGHAGLDLIEPISNDENEKAEEEKTSEEEPQLPKDNGKIETLFEIQKRLVFAEAYGSSLSTNSGHEKTYQIKVREFRRLTPDTYDRNVFHVDFDTSNSGFKYEIGDALGVFGHNDPKAAEKFIRGYNLDADLIVTSYKDGASQTRSVRQWITQALDIFGRPSKKFYTQLADYATDEAQAEKLRWLTTSEGSEEFKARVADTVTYADLLEEFTSARPSLIQLIEIVPAIKPRHYSIASSSNMHPDSVQLLVVAVDWKTSKGELRTGQCTRFLKSLNVGDQVTVTVKPSVMKLPEDDERPIIMAGLGTGMAPFRAFIEERAVRRRAGKKVGPIVLYFGSRYRAAEYLYGEELEAYEADGLLTHLRLAFSRDQKEKVYIQHRMQEDAEILSEFMLKQGGHFYLCGPTWPAGDVKDAMVYGFTNYGQVKPSEANKVIETMKDEERYILEVY